MRWDHPRVCGEHRIHSLDQIGVLGSSPRMRGTRVSAERIENILGIIPAYAGNTNVCNAMPAHLRDHPRVCGEHFITSDIRQEMEDHPRVCGEHMCKVMCVTP